jgi:hypothetical protein
MLLNVQVEQAKRAYETGGREALAGVLARFQQIAQVKVFFTDAPTAPICSPGRLTRSWSAYPSAAAGAFPSPSAADRRLLRARIPATATGCS